MEKAIIKMLYIILCFSAAFKYGKINRKYGEMVCLLVSNLWAMLGVAIALFY